jgi:hypothetical protein
MKVPSIFYWFYLGTKLAGPNYMTPGRISAIFEDSYLEKEWFALVRSQYIHEDTQKYSKLWPTFSPKSAQMPYYLDSRYEEHNLTLPFLGRSHSVKLKISL